MAGFGRRVRTGLVDATATAVALAVAVLAALLLQATAGGDLVYRFGGWHPEHGVALGITFVVGPFGAGLALLAGVVVTAAFWFSWRFFDEVGVLFHVLVLVFLAAMVGFVLTGDLFNLFVFFELMSVSAFALTAYRSDQAAPLHGAFNFAVSNTIAAFLILCGIGLLYGRTGALNLAQIGRDLAARRPDGLVVVAVVLIACGFLVKAAAVPFHFWLADAYAVAPAPVCVLFSAVMSDLGLYAVARVYWTVFSGPVGLDPVGVRDALLVIGVLTALTGAVMAFLQRHLKRMLAFTTISQIGVLLIGVALLTAPGLAGSAVELAADGLVRGGLFLIVGTLIHRLGSGDELALRGRGRRLWPAGVVCACGALGLAGLPPFGTFLGSALITHAAGTLGEPVIWVPAVAGAVTAAALLRATGRVFLGLGGAREPWLTDQPDHGEHDEPEGGGRRRTIWMTAPAAVLVAAGLALGLVPQLAGHADLAAARFVDRPAYAHLVLHSPVAAAARLPVATSGGPDRSSYAIGAGSTLAALMLALAALFHRRLPDRFWRAAAPATGPLMSGLRGLHSGRVGDYVAWLAAGVAVLGAVFAFTLT